MAKHKPESAAIKAFKSKYGNAKKPFPSQEAAALEAAEERNYNESVKAKQPVVKEKPKKEKAIEVAEDPDRQEFISGVTKTLEKASKHLQVFTSDKETGKPAVVDAPKKEKKGK